MLQILRYYVIPKKIVSATGLLYNKTKSPVLVGDSVSKSFDVNIDVLQGDTLELFLFVIVLDWVMRQATVDNSGFVVIPRQSRRQPEYKLSDHGYADDIDMLLSSIRDVQKFFDPLVLAALDVGLHVNATKTKVLVLSHPRSPTLRVNNIDFDFVDDFKCLLVGSYNLLPRCQATPRSGMGCLLAPFGDKRVFESLTCKSAIKVRL